MREQEILKRLTELYKQSQDLRNRQYEAATRCECWSREVLHLSKEIAKIDDEISLMNSELQRIWDKKSQQADGGRHKPAE